LKPTQSRPTGRFSYDVLGGKWDWDDEVFRIHGLEPGSVTPDTELILASKHPDDRARVARLIDEVGQTGAAFSISYRILLPDGSEKRVVLVGQGEFGEEVDRPHRVEGFYIDLTPDFEEESEEYAKAAVAASALSRAVIEQAKGALMLSYGLDSEQAFAMLRWWSRNRNVKVRDLAERIVVLATEGEATDAGLRQSIDSALHDLTE
jgi:hypothetical protein